MSVYKGGKQYTESDLKMAFESGDFNSWDELIEWLKVSDQANDTIQSGKIGQMIYQLQRLKEEDVPFTKDYQVAFKLAQDYANIELQEENDNNA